MKKVYTLVLAAILSAISLLPIAGGTSKTTATLHLRAVVHETAEISIESRSRSLTRSTEPDGSVLMGVVRERSNSSRGYQVTLESENASRNAAAAGLLHSHDSENALPYQIQYGDTAVDFSEGRAVVSDMRAATTGEGLARELRISYGDAQSVYGDTPYSDTLIMTLAAN